MITNTGKGIVAKYLIGQAPAYASYIALGSGAKPLTSGDVLDTATYFDKTSLDFEMFRVPITSRGYVTDIVGGQEVSKVVFTAELPTEQRYEVSEIGVYSAKSNPSATARDSRILYTFTESENWEYHQETSAVGLGSTVTAPLDGNDGSGSIVTPAGHDVVFRTTNDNVLFSNPSRLSRYERCRFLNSSVMIPGDMSLLTISGSGEMIAAETDINGYHRNHIHLSGTSIDLGKNSPGDEIRIAFSVINKDPIGDDPSRVVILVEFANSDTVETAEYAKFQIDFDSTRLANGRYLIEKKQIADLIKSGGFSWSDVNIVKVYVTIFDQDDLPSSNWYVMLDAMRFENTTTQNPVYGLTGYSPVMTADGNAFVKGANTSNLIEFRFGLDVS